ncbi:hypothetical protein GCM10011396_38220 [Undibacterium terreum]|uniref:Uncharacterized protein n=1 Tax=Undibacterium terreum TaxID=1224302 RepID=A0A916XNG7_9BURK|nr:hypothetical protein GCM10011396_38220 [Undibacterium terreum]
MLQVPAAVNETVDPDTVHTPDVFDEKLTANPEEAVAATVNELGKIRSLSDPKLIVCDASAPVTTNDRVTGDGAKKLRSPSEVAVIEQVPGPTSVTIASDKPLASGSYSWFESVQTDEGLLEKKT